MHSLQNTTRRHFLGRGSLGLGAVAAGLLNGPISAAPDTKVADNPLSPKKPHFPAKAKRVIYLHMSGAPPHLDLFDYKPELVKRTGENVPDSYLKGRRFAFTSGVPKLLGTPQKFEKRGKSGLWMSDALATMHGLADDIAVIKSMKTEEFNHAPAELLLFTGHNRQGRPGMGTWVTYGLGSESENLPGFVVLVSSGVQPSGGANIWGNGFLPSVYQGVQCRSKGDPVLYVSDPKGMDRDLRRKTLDALKDLNTLQADELGHPETATRIQQYEMAFRMQTAVPEVMDINKETKETLEAYGAKPGESSFANNCLLARRMAEKGVRFVQLFDWGWDFHGTGPAEDIRDGLTKKCGTVGKPISALIADLKRLGMFDDTLVVWSGEFGRTPFREGRTAGGQVLGRDHYPDCFCVWMAGAGVKRGVSYGETEDLGFAVSEKVTTPHDLQATILHLMGIEHTKLTYRFQGRDYRLTDVHGEVVKDVLS
jgi:Protein of unknown function (DUF1501)